MKDRLVDSAPDIERETFPRTLVIGVGGLVGSRFIELNQGVSSITAISGRKDLDITESRQISRALDQFQPEVVINFGAMTNVDEAENQRGDKTGPTWQVNVAGPMNLVEACKPRGIHLVQLSTDFVFPGTEDNRGPYQEYSRLPESPDQLSWYGWTKLEGEKRVRKIGGSWSIVRIAYPFKAYHLTRSDFARRILDLYDHGRLYPMFADQWLTPTFIDELVPVLETLARERKNGIYHVASSNLTTPYEFSCYLLAQARGLSEEKVIELVGRASILDFQKCFPQKARRLQYGGLRTRETQRKLGVRFPTWPEAVDKLVAQLKVKNAN